jgi:hypothetical protein
VRAGLAVLLALTFPVVVFWAHPAPETIKAYQDALAAVIAGYFGASNPSAGVVGAARARRTRTSCVRWRTE